MRDPSVFVGDANILLRYVDTRTSKHLEVAQSLSSIGERNILLAPQAMYESWVVMTRPLAGNGFGWQPQKAHSALVRLRNTFRFVPDPLDLMDEWLDLCLKHRVSGKPAHDARLAAYALAVGAGGIVTLNPGDFKRFGVTVLVP